MRESVWLHHGEACNKTDTVIYSDSTPGGIWCRFSLRWHSSLHTDERSLTYTLDSMVASLQAPPPSLPCFTMVLWRQAFVAPGMAWLHLLSCLWTKLLSFAEMVTATADDTADTSPVLCSGQSLPWDCPCLWVSCHRHLIPPPAAPFPHPVLAGMTAKPPSFSSFSRSLLSWFGILLRPFLGRDGPYLFSQCTVLSSFGTDIIVSSSLYPEKMGFKCLLNMAALWCSCLLGEWKVGSERLDGLATVRNNGRQPELLPIPVLKAFTPSPSILNLPWV